MRAFVTFYLLMYRLDFVFVSFTNNKVCVMNLIIITYFVIFASVPSPFSLIYIKGFFFFFMSSKIRLKITNYTYFINFAKLKRQKI